MCLNPYDHLKEANSADAAGPLSVIIISGTPYLAKTGVIDGCALNVFHLVHFYEVGVAVHK